MGTLAPSSTQGSGATLCDCSDHAVVPAIIFVSKFSFQA